MSCVMTTDVTPWPVRMRSMSSSTRDQGLTSVVVDEDLGLGDDRARNADAPFHATGELAGQLPRRVVDVELTQRRMHAPRNLAVAEACLLPQREGDVVEDGHRVEKRVLLEHDGELAADAIEVALTEPDEIRAVDPNFARVRSFEAHEEARKGALSGARSADDDARLPPGRR